MVTVESQNSLKWTETFRILLLCQSGVRSSRGDGFFFSWPSQLAYFAITRYHI